MKKVTESKRVSERFRDAWLVFMTRRAAEFAKGSAGAGQENDLISVSGYRVYSWG